MTRTIPGGLVPELQSLARIIFGFLIFRHGMEQVFGFPAAWREAAALSSFTASRSSLARLLRIQHRCVRWPAYWNAWAVPC